MSMLALWICRWMTTKGLTLALAEGAKVQEITLATAKMAQSCSFT
jgi:hypothetical protein